MSHLAPRRLRAPQEDGAALIDPPLDQAPALIEHNRAIATRFQAASGFTSAFRDQARAGLLDPPRIGVEPVAKRDTNRSIVATGHQPELFHPGVWFKNFVADGIARKVDADAANIIVDNDLARSSGIRVPTLLNGGTRISDAFFDAPAAATTWENWNVTDTTTFRQFATDVRRLFEPLMRSRDFAHGIILDRLWPHAIESLDRQDREFRDFASALAECVDEMQPTAFTPFGMLGHCLAEARSRVESDLGLTISDCPLSELADHSPFLEFIRLLLVRHVELHTIHNAALAEYRTVNHIRSRSHPVPELAQEGEWLEMPLWIWTFDNPQRRRVFVRKSGSSFELSDRGQPLISLPATDSSQYRRILTSNHVQLRPRALITTMYARLVLSDLFIHGIGGAKYDELTDLIIRRFFGIEPPAFVTATATFRLPIDRPKVSLEDVRTSAQRIRELRYRPESLVRDPLVRDDAHIAPRLAALADEKRSFLDQHDLRRCSQQVFDRLDSLNRAMHDLLRPIVEQMHAQHEDVIAQAKQAQLLSSREFSFVLFPSEILPARLLALSQASS